MTVRNTARRYYRNKVPAVFLKLDIAKAFDSIRWDYLLSLLQHLGFRRVGATGSRRYYPLPPPAFS